MERRSVTGFGGSDREKPAASRRSDTLPHGNTARPNRAPKSDESRKDGGIF
jgi:hypothetical protein